jgi:hypothetical protein
MHGNKGIIKLRVNFTTLPNAPICFPTRGKLNPVANEDETIQKDPPIIAQIIPV